MHTQKRKLISHNSISQFAGGAKQSPLLNDLRAQIRQIEQSQTPFLENAANWHSPTCNTSSIEETAHPRASIKSGWNFGVSEIDEVLPEFELSQSALHEIKPATYLDSHAAFGFAMALAGRRLNNLPDAHLLWCLPPLVSNEFGAPYGPGLKRLIPRPENCLITQPKTHAHLLWAMEEGLSASGDTSVGTSAFAVVFANLKSIEPTPARRLSLRAANNHIPALLLTHHDTPGINMAETRWRIGRAQSDSGSHLAAAPGHAKWTVTLERARDGREGLNWIIDWHHETHSFTLASPLANRAAQATPARFGVG